MVATGLRNHPGAECAKELEIELYVRIPLAGIERHSKTQRLSTTDISALASMKNVAKCDTWCELQNPVNHRVFERKLRPKPIGRGHVCLGVTHLLAPTTHSLMRCAGFWAEIGLPCLVVRLVQKRVSGGGRRDIGGCKIPS